MPEPTVDRDPVEFLAAEFVDRLRDGEHPTVEEYAAAHPHWAEQIRDLFPTIAAMEKLKLDKEVSSGGRASLGPTKIEQLGDLRIIREIGRGGMGIVYEAEQESLARRVAVKVLPKQSLFDAKHLRRFRREAKTAAKLHHTNIVPILGVGEQDGFHYYVMQYIRGAGLDEIIPQLNDLSTANGIAVTSADGKQRAANVSSVARALVNGQLRSLGKAQSSWDSEIDSGSKSASGTDSNRTAITEVVPPGGGTARVGESDVLADGLETADSDDADAATESTAAMTVRFGMSYWQSVAKIGVQVANALNYAHRQGTLHRDIKPANLLIDEGGTIWVADFGLAKAMEQDNVSRTGDIVGTLRYMAPEQFLGQADARSDIYSLGLTLYELLALKPAFDDTQRKRSFLHDAGPLEPVRPRRANPLIPRDLETIVLKAIAAEPDARYQTSGELSDDLQRFLEDRPIRARRASVAERLRRWARRNPAVATLSGIATSLLLLVAIISTTAYFQTKSAMEAAVDAETSERQQRVKAEATSELAWDALDRIFERLAPHRYVAPEDFAVETEQSADFNVNSQPVLSDEAAALLDEMLVFYRKLAAQGDDTDEFRQRIAEANRRVGDIRQRLGQFAQAKQAYQRAIAVYSQLEDGGKTNPKQAAALAGIYNELGQVYRKSRQHDEARDAFDSARAILEPVAKRSSPPEVRYELARSFYLRVHRSGGRGRGRGFAPPGSKRGGPRRDGNGGSAGRPGDPSRRNGDIGRESEKMERAIELLEELTAEYEVPDYQQLLALCYAERHLYLRASEREQAEQSINKAVALLEQLVARYPRNPDYRFTLSTVYTTGLREFGPPPSTDDLAEIEDRASKALELLDQLHRDHPSVPDYVMSEVEVHRGLGMRLGQANRIEDAQLHFNEAFRLHDELNESERADIGHIMHANFSRISYAGMLVAHYRKTKETSGEPDHEWLLEAREQLRTCIEKTKPFAGIDSRHHGFIGFPYKLLYTVSIELGDEQGAAEAEQAMKKYLSSGMFEGGDRRRGRKPDGGERGSGNGPPPRPPDRSPVPAEPVSE